MNFVIVDLERIVVTFYPKLDCVTLICKHINNGSSYSFAEFIRFCKTERENRQTKL